VRQRIESAAGLRPVAPALAQEGDQPAIVHRQNRIEAEVARRDHLAQLFGFHALQNDLGAARDLVRLHHLAFEQLDIAVLVAMLLAVDGMHRRPAPGPR
jgi:hypothetical protein